MTNKELTGLMIKQLLHEWECTKSISTAYDICSTLCEYYKINGKDTGKASSNDSWKLLDIYMNIGKIMNQKEPLIKDEKLRGIIRSWATLNGVTELKYNIDENSLTDIFRNTISFNHLLDLQDYYTYDIIELCGKEE